MRTSKKLTARLVVVARVAEEVGDLVFLTPERKREGEGEARLGSVRVFAVAAVFRVQAVEASCASAQVCGADATLFAAVTTVVTFTFMAEISLSTCVSILATTWIVYDRLFDLRYGEG